MNALILIVLFCILLLLCWPLAIVALLLLPILWLIALPFRLAWLVMEGMLAFIRALLFLPSRLLGGRRW